MFRAMYKTILYNKFSNLSFVAIKRLHKCIGLMRINHWCIRCVYVVAVLCPCAILFRLGYFQKQTRLRTVHILKCAISFARQFKLIFKRCCFGGPNCEG